MISKNYSFSKRQIALLIGDLIVLVLAPFISTYIHLWITLGIKFKVVTLSIHPVVLLNILIFISFLYLFDQYNFRQDFRKKATFHRIAGAVVLGAMIMIFTFYIFAVPMLPRSIYVIYSTVLFSGFYCFRLLYSLIGAVGVYDTPTLIVGCGESGRELAASIRNAPHSGLKMIGFLDINREKEGTVVEGLPVYLQEGSLPEAVRELKPQMLIVAMRRSRLYNLSKELAWCAQQGIRIWDIPTAFEHIEKRIPLAYVDDIWLLYTNLARPQIHVRHLKRILDIIVSSVGILLSTPILILTALAVWLETGRPVVLVQRRLGRYGRIIPLYKFRSMTQSEPIPGEKGTDRQDKRVTRVGRVIRNLHFDELPQLFNVLKGDLSMVGPRAELFDFIHEYIGEISDEWKTMSKLQHKLTSRFSLDSPQQDDKLDEKKDIAKLIPYIEQRFTIEQGVTGWAQVMQPYVTSTYEDMVKKFEYDLYYLKNASLSLDLIILLMTVRLVLTGKGK